MLVPTTPDGGLWTADHDGVRWICAFSDEAALARFARARGEAPRAWRCRTLPGAHLLDEVAPLLGAPAGVALDAGSDHAALFPHAGGGAGAAVHRDATPGSRP